MDIIFHIKNNLTKIEKLLAEIKKDLDKLTKENIKASDLKKVGLEAEESACLEKYKLEYENLYNEFIKGNPKSIEEFIKSKTKSYLKTFCKANNLPIDTTKISKEAIIKEVIQWMVQRNAITKKAK